MARDARLDENARGVLTEQEIQKSPKVITEIAAGAPALKAQKEIAIISAGARTAASPSLTQQIALAHERFGNPDDITKQIAEVDKAIANTPFLPGSKQYDNLVDIRNKLTLQRNELRKTIGAALSGWQNWTVEP